MTTGNLEPELAVEDAAERSWMKRLGPGLITGAADDDPSGIALTFMRLDPIKALYWSAVINGVAAVPIMVLVMVRAASPKVIGQFVVTGWLRRLGWIATAAMGLAAIGMFWPT